MHCCPHVPDAAGWQRLPVLSRRCLVLGWLANAADTQQALPSGRWMAVNASTQQVLPSVGGGRKSAESQQALPRVGWVAGSANTQ